MQSVLEKYTDIHKAICKVFGDMETFLEEYRNQSGDFTSNFIDNFGGKLVEVEIYFHEYKDDSPRNISDDELEEYEKYIHSYFENELNYFIYDYKKIRGK